MQTYQLWAAPAGSSTLVEIMTIEHSATGLLSVADVSTLLCDVVKERVKQNGGIAEIRDGSGNVILRATIVE